MSCENDYCIYNVENKCRFEKVAINSLGMCESCIIVSLDKSFLEMEKKKQRTEIDMRLGKNRMQCEIIFLILRERKMFFHYFI